MMFRHAVFSFLFASAPLPAFSNGDCDFEYKEVIRESNEYHFDPSMNHREVVVDLFRGSIHVEGYRGQVVQLESIRTITARSESRAAVALDEVTLEVKEYGDAVIAYAEGPFRDRDGENSYRGCRYYGYKNAFDVRLRVPFNTDVYLKTVNGGKVVARNTAGKFDLHNINGSVEMREISGSGKAYALNGTVDVSFRENPDTGCYFGSLNGAVTVAFPSELNADLFFQTRNGSVYSDFEATSVPVEALLNEGEDVVEHDGGMKVYNTRRFDGIRIGSGGPKVEFNAFNGNIYIKKTDTVRGKREGFEND